MVRLFGLSVITYSVIRFRSNVLVSTFFKVVRITTLNTILKFYNYELGTKPSNWPHLNVSINTDDAGVFNTTLENEFTLMALAMTKAKDEKGNSKYSQEAIFRWLDRVREMGNEQAPPALQ